MNVTPYLIAGYLSILFSCWNKRYCHSYLSVVGSHLAAALSDAAGPQLIQQYQRTGNVSD